MSKIRFAVDTRTQQQPDFQPEMNNSITHLKRLQRTTPDKVGSLSST